MKRIIIAITGASGVIFGIKLLEMVRSYNALQHQKILTQELEKLESHIVISPAAIRNISIETEYDINYIEALAHITYEHSDIGAAIASGSFITEGMVVVPCTIKTLSGISNSYNCDLITRAADVCLKERRTLVLGVRETPFHIGHLQLMTKAASIGAIIMPPIPSFYQKPKTIEDLTTQFAGRILHQLGIKHPDCISWTGVDNI